MGAAPYTPEDEQRYRLPPLPDPPFFGTLHAEALNKAYSIQRIRYRQEHPDRTRDSLVERDAP